MSETQDLLLRTLDRVIEDTLETSTRSAADRNPGWPAEVWDALAEQGMIAIGEPTEAEPTFADVMALVRRAAFHAAPVPIAETILARRMLGGAGIDLPDGALSVAPPGAGQGVRFAGGRLSGIASGVAWGSSVSGIVVAADDHLVLVDPSAASAGAAYNMAGEPRDAVDLARARIIASAPFVEAAAVLEAQGALVRSVQLAGASSRVLEHCMTWVNERIQFGKPIAKFQAIQHLMAEMAAEVAAGSAAVELAVEANAAGSDRLTVAIAKARGGEAAGRICAIAHEVFGAMGFTQEHTLHYATRRLWSWRDEFGPEVQWQAEIGRTFAANGADALWPALTALG